ncbi:MAG: hypothetical protein AAGC44_00920 [Planctomycetota bacterium]
MSYEPLDILWMRTWWSYASAEDPLHAVIYRSINVIEGLFWLGFAVLVLRRRQQQPAENRSGLEIAYALTFVAFGITDFREAVALQSWLIWVKLANLILLLWLRHRVIRVLYPASKLY